MLAEGLSFSETEVVCKPIDKCAVLNLITCEGQFGKGDYKEEGLLKVFNVM